MYTGWLLIICSYCCLHLNPIWSELSPRSSPNPQSSAAWLQRFPLSRFLFVALRGLSTLSLQNDNECLSLANPAAGVRAARAEGDARSPAPGGSCPRPQLRGCGSHPGLSERGSEPSPAPTRLLGQYSRHSVAGSDLKDASSETPE